MNTKKVSQNKENAYRISFFSRIDLKFEMCFLSAVFDSFVKRKKVITKFFPSLSFQFISLYTSANESDLNIGII